MRIVLVPGALALLPEYAGLADPVLDLRLACLDAVSWLGSDVVVLGDPQGVRVGEALLSAAGVSRRDFVPPQPPGAGFVPPQPPGAGFVLPQPPGAGFGPPRPPGAAYLVVGNGSARRSEKAPGHLDERSFAFDDSLRAALASSDTSWPHFELGRGLLASLDGIRELFDLLPAGTEAQVDYDDDPFGVQYWVMRWACGS